MAFPEAHFWKREELPVYHARKDRKLQDVSTIKESAWGKYTTIFDKCKEKHMKKEDIVMELAMANGFGGAGFTELDEQEMMWVDGGGIWSGIASIVSGTAVSLAACVAVITATTISVPATLACGGAYCLGKLAVGVGIIDNMSGE